MAAEMLADRVDLLLQWLDEGALCRVELDGRLLLELPRPIWTQAEILRAEYRVQLNMPGQGLFDLLWSSPFGFATRAQMRPSEAARLANVLRRPRNSSRSRLWLSAGPTNRLSEAWGFAGVAESDFLGDAFFVDRTDRRTTVEKYADQERWLKRHRNSGRLATSNGNKAL